MAAPTPAEMLKYANLQLAAEALYDFRAKLTPSQTPGDLISTEGHYFDAIRPDILTTGNEHASRFAPTEAEKFVKDWIVIDHLSNTTTGFSGTLFYNEAEKQYVLSIRSTEFIDDTLRDSVATNAMEIKEFGWAFGQISDMEAWYAQLTKPGGPLEGKHFSVTGYSLGGHLATAFNLLRHEDGSAGNVDRVVTFNGAGVGQVGFPLSQVINDFNALRAAPESIAARFSDAGLGTLYQTLRERLSDGHSPTADDYALLHTVSAAATDDVGLARFASERKQLSLALDRLKNIKQAVTLLAEVTDTKDGQPAAIPERVVAQARFEYQMALLVAQEFKTTAKALLPAAINIVLGKSDGAPRLDNQFDVVGRETTTLVTAMVADSQWHHGANVDVFIEDQPLVRGTIRKAAAGVYWDTGALMPINNYTQNDFGDTHSIVLLIDSLSVQHLLQTLAPTATQADIETLFKAASVVKAESTTGTQGRAEGDGLETLLDSLLRVFTHDDPELRQGKAKNGNGLLTGGTWADESLRETFYDKLKALGDSPAFKEAKGKLTLTLPGRDLATAARSDFAAFLTLHTGSSFALKAVPGQESTLEAALKAQWTAEYTAWKADQDLTPEQRANLEGTYTDRYLADRAAFLARLAQARLANTGEGQALRVTTLDTGLRHFKDEASGLSLQEVHALTGAAARARVVFGGDGNDSVVGETGEDAFYGGAGSDQLDGGAGDDILEGNADADELRGGAGRDTLLGGQGNDRLEGGDNNDTLVGGQGDDTLVGGDGEDTYVINTGDGNDHIVDTGMNFIKYNGRLVTGLFLKSTDSDDYTFAGDDGFVMRFHSPGVLTLDDTTSLTFDNYTSAEAFAASNFGIRLAQAPDASRVTRTIVGDLRLIDLHHDDLFNYVGDPSAPAPGATDLMHNSPGNDRIILGDGFNMALAVPDAAGYTQNYMTQRSGDDWISGGMNVDFVAGGTGRDYIEGGAGGDDLLAGGDADDVIFGDLAATLAVQIREAGNNEPGDLVSGQGGNDALYGSSSSDLIYGGAGDDFLGGLGGDDFLLGDVDFFLYGVWDVRRDGLNFIFDFTQILSSSRGDQYQEGPAGSGNDVIMGDKGNDAAWGGAGNDYIDGGSDNDTLRGGDGNDRLKGGDGEDFLSGGADDDTLEGDAGNDTLIGDGGGDELHGAAGNDELHGDTGDALVTEQGDDRLFGDAGDDYMRGYGGNDTLDGGAGHDDLSGGGNDDVLDGGEGNDTLFGDDGLDTLLGGTGTDYLDSGADDDLLDGGSGNDALRGGDGDDLLDGGSGSDGLRGGDGADTLIGGTDTDYLEGGAGDDIYLFAAGDSPRDADGFVEYVVDAEGDNTIVFSNATPTDLRIANSGGSLLITYGTNDQLLIKDGLAGSIGHYRFANGETLSYSELIGRLVDTPMGAASGGRSFWFGGSLDDYLVATDGHTTFSGGRGDDTLIGYGGRNTYLYSRGDGTDRIIDTSTKTDADGTALPNTLRFGAGITADDIRLAIGSLKILVGSNPDDAIHIDGFDPDDALGTKKPPAIDRFEFADGTALSYGELLARGFDLTGTTGNDTLTGTSVNDRLDGGAGNDSLRGGAGSDTYFWGLDSGNDTIDNSDSSLDTDRLIIGNGLLADDLIFARSHDDLVIRVRTSGEHVLVLRHFAGAPIDRVRFADGSEWNGAEIATHLSTELSEGADIYTATLASDTIDALGGDDLVDGLAGDDVITGGRGNDTLRGGAGSDHYRFAVGDGSDLIVDDDVTADHADVVEFLDVASSVVTVTRPHNGNDLVLAYGGSDRLTIQAYFAGASHQIEEFRFADSVRWNVGDLQERVLVTGTAGKDVINGQAGTDNRLYGFDGDDSLNGAEVADTLAGGRGNDRLAGGFGADIYLFANGDGADVINETNDTNGTVDTLRLTDLAAAAVSELARVGSDLIVRLGGSDQVTVRQQYNAATSAGIEQITFADGLTWTADDIKARLSTLGTSAADSLTGFDGVGNRLFGFDGSDTLSGGDRGDLLDGGNGNDWLEGLAGADTLVGGAGNDVYDIDDANDLIIEHAGEGRDTAYSWVSFDLASQGSGVEVLTLLGSNPLGAAGNELDNVINGNAAANVLKGGAGNDTLRAYGGSDNLDGGSGRDDLWGGEGDDTLDGGTGDDTLSGVFGADTYLFRRGSGTDRIIDDRRLGAPVDRDNIRFDEGIRMQDLTIAVLSDESWQLTLAGSSDSLVFVKDAGSRFADGQPVIPIESLQFADGTRVDLTGALVGTAGADRLAASFFAIPTFGPVTTATINVRIDAQAGNDTVTGGGGNDSLRGGDGDDVLYGDSGSRSSSDDQLYGDAGDDTLYGGSSMSAREGADLLDGGAGNDLLYHASTVRYGRGYGQDRVIGKVERIDLFDLLPSDVTLQYQPDGLYFRVKDSADWLKLEADGRRITVEQVNFANGSSWDRRAIEAMAATQGNLAPQADVPLLPVSAREGEAFTVVLPEIAFRDPNPGDLLTWSVNLPDEPAWLRFDPLTRTLSGTPTNADVGSHDLFVTAADRSGASASQALKVIVADVNQAPVVNAPIETLTFREGMPIRWTIPSDTFADEDPGEVLTLHAALTTGDPLPSWLAIDARTGDISGIAPVGARGNLNLRITATDRAGASVATPLTLQIAAASPAALLGTANKDVLVGTSGNDLLNGAAGADTMRGGDGDDTYVVDERGDTVVELANQGSDTVWSLVSHTLADNVENLVLAAGASINGTGNALRNRLTGNSGNNVLDGGAEADTLEGGTGNDTYYVGDKDTVIEAADAGKDTIVSGIRWTLGANVENLTLTGTAPPSTPPATPAPTPSTGTPTVPSTSSPAASATTSTTSAPATGWSKTPTRATTASMATAASTRSPPTSNTSSSPSPRPRRSPATTSPTACAATPATTGSPDSPATTRSMAGSAPTPSSAARATTATPSTTSPTRSTKTPTPASTPSTAASPGPSASTSNAST